MRIHWLGHVPFEDPANISLWARQHAHELTATRLYDDETLPDIARIDALAVMGGPMNVHEHRRYRWLVPEKHFIEQAFARRIPVLGICLGAQLLADVLGARITKNPNTEIGWFPVRMTPEAHISRITATLPSEFTAFHWHGDTFDIPAGASHLAHSQACPNQAFLYDKSVLALQFHLEYSQQSIHKMLENCGYELIDAPHIQSRDEILAGTEDNVTATSKLLFALLDRVMAEPAD